MVLQFTKMHGLGNDFIVIDCTKTEVTSPNILAKNLCRRRFGIGADQVLLVMPSESSDFKMRIFNADGGEVEMCGNGIRCFAKYVLNKGLTQKSNISVETQAGIISPNINGELVEVDMGEPILEGRNIPVNKEGLITSMEFKVLGRIFYITCVSMGNPHCVIIVEDIADLDIGKYGPLIENNSFFPKRTNVEFVQIINLNEIAVKVWERGAGITMACGTGACASVVASVLNKKTDRDVTAHMDGGDLYIKWLKDNNRVIMSGPAEFIFEGSVVI